MQKLTDAELALLTEAQKEAYEKQMHEYQQREAFVERLEYLEKVKLPQPKPKMKPVKIIKPPAFTPIVSLDEDDAENTEVSRQEKVSILRKYKVKVLPAVTMPNTKHKKITVPQYMVKPSHVHVVSPAAVACIMADKPKLTKLPIAPVARVKEKKVTISDFRVKPLQRVIASAPKGCGKLVKAKITIPERTVITAPAVSIKKDSSSFKIKPLTRKTVTAPNVERKIKDYTVTKTVGLSVKPPVVKHEAVSFKIQPHTVKLPKPAGKVTIVPMKPPVQVKCTVASPHTVAYTEKPMDLKKVEIPHLECPKDTEQRCQDTLAVIMKQLRG